MSINIEALKSAAAAFKPGKWEVIDQGRKGKRDILLADVAWGNDYVAEEVPEQVAPYIALCSPDNILALIEGYERMAVARISDFAHYKDSHETRLATLRECLEIAAESCNVEQAYERIRVLTTEEEGEKKK